MQANATDTVVESNSSEARTVAAARVPRFAYALTADAEIWDAIDGDTREDAARAAFAIEMFVNEIFICDREPIAKARAFELSVHVETILDDADSAAYEHLPCTHHDGSLFASDRPALDALKARLVSACAGWLREYPGPDVWTAGTVTAHLRDGVTQ